MTVYTLGYEGIDLQTYVRILKTAGVGLVIDVRETPWSYKREFCKSSLCIGLGDARIEYVHMRSAGNPKEIRRTAPNTRECLRRYGAYLTANPTGVTDLINAITSATNQNLHACLTCFERDPETCHRSVLLSAMQKRMQDLEAVHLQGSVKKQMRLLRVPNANNHETVRIKEKVS